MWRSTGTFPGQCIATKRYCTTLRLHAVAMTFHQVLSRMLTARPTHYFASALSTLNRTRHGTALAPRLGTLKLLISSWAETWSSGGPLTFENACSGAMLSRTHRIVIRHIGAADDEWLLGINHFAGSSVAVWPARLLPTPDGNGHEFFDVTFGQRQVTMITLSRPNDWEATTFFLALARLAGRPHACRRFDVEARGQSHSRQQKPRHRRCGSCSCILGVAQDVVQSVRKKSGGLHIPQGSTLCETLVVIIKDVLPMKSDDKVIAIVQKRLQILIQRGSDCAAELAELDEGMEVLEKRDEEQCKVENSRNSTNSGVATANLSSRRRNSQMSWPLESIRIPHRCQRESSLTPTRLRWLLLVRKCGRIEGWLFGSDNCHRTLLTTSVVRNMVNRRPSGSCLGYSGDCGLIPLALTRVTTQSTICDRHASGAFWLQLVVMRHFGLVARCEQQFKAWLVAVIASSCSCGHEL